MKAKPTGAAIADLIARLQDSERERRRRERRERGPRAYVVLHNPPSLPNRWLPTTIDEASGQLVPLVGRRDQRAVVVFPSRTLASRAARLTADAANDPRGELAFIIAPRPPQAQGGAK